MLDFLVEEVLQQQLESVQTFLLRTSILDRMCGPLCDAVLLASSASGQETASQETLEYLEHANLFIVPLDDERRWYRYHHLFGELLLQRLHRSASAAPGEERPGIAELHIRASAWYEANGLGMEAFRHAAAANDVERAERLMEGNAIPRHSRGALKTVVEWLASLPKSVLDARPLLWVRSATMTLMPGQTTGVEEKLQAAEEALENAPLVNEAHLGLARIHYEWNDLGAAERHGQQSLQLARLYDRMIDRFIIGEVFLARLKLARGDVVGAAAMLAEAGQAVRQNNFVQRMPEVGAAQLRTLLRLGDLAAAADLAQTHDFPISRARVHLAQGDSSAALAVLEPFRQQMETRGWADKRLDAMVLQAVALHLKGEKTLATQVLGEALALAEPGGFIHLFVDEGPSMAQLLSEATAHGVMPDYIGKLLAAFQR